MIWHENRHYWDHNLETQPCLFFSFKVSLLNLEILNFAKNIPFALSSSTIKIWDTSGKGFASYDRTYKDYYDTDINIFE